MDRERTTVAPGTGRNVRDERNLRWRWHGRARGPLAGRQGDALCLGCVPGVERGFWREWTDGEIGEKRRNWL
jgi:hypothetical protein